MSIYSREALLQLRESPLVATAAPDLPSWISSEAIEKAQKEPRVSARTNGADADNDGFILREPKSRREPRDKDTRASSDRLFERRNPLTKEDRGFDKNDVFKSLREPRRPDAAEENFASRRNAKKQQQQQQQQPARETTEPAWAAQEKKQSTPASNAHKDEDDDATGKTADDFERWKASMRKAEGLEAGAQASESVLPPLPAQDSPAKDIKAPPGFTPAMASTEDGEALMNKLFAAGSSTMPSTDKQTKASPPQQQPTGSLSGSSKFSKFFSASQPASASRTDARQTQQAQQERGPDIFAALSGTSGDSNKPKNKDDAEGLERILAMLSSSQIKSNEAAAHQASRPTHDHGAVHDDVYASRGNNPSQPLRGSGYAGPTGPSPYPQYGERMQGPAFFGARHPASPQQERQMPSYSPEYGYLSYAPAGPPAGMMPGAAFSGRLPMPMHGPLGHPGVPPMPMAMQPMQPMPAMRDGTTGAGSILGHHAQNQDFFSSLLSQAGPQQQETLHHMGGPSSPQRTMAGPAGGRPPPKMHEQNQQQTTGPPRRYDGMPPLGAQQGAQGHHPQAWPIDPRTMQQQQPSSQSQSYR